MFHCVVFLFFILGRGFCTEGEKYFPTMDSFITSYNYSYENHTVLTEDGYYLTLGRIPVRLNGTCEKSKGPVVLYHGMVNNGMIFFYLGPELSFGFAIADDCFDVWIPNTRGTRYSERHINYTIYNREFWNFSYDELAKYEIKAIIDHILKETGGEKIQFIGFSQGATQILMFLCQNLEYEKNISSLQLMAPIAYMDDYKEFPKKLPIQYLYTLSKYGSDFAHRPLPGYDYIFNDLLFKLCESDTGTDLCTFIVRPIRLPDKENLGPDWQWAYHFPERVTLKTLAHYAQIHVSSRFQMYDYGPEENLKRYNTELPPLYHVENLTSPAFIYHGKEDAFSTVQSVNRLAREYSNLKLKYFIDSNWGHNDFVTCAKSEYPHFRDKLLESLNQFT